MRLPRSSLRTIHRKDINVGNKERWASTIVGILLFIHGLRHRSTVGLISAILGLCLLKRGTTGHCSCYSALNINHTRSANARIVIHRSITINKPPTEVYAFWRIPENFAQLSPHIEVRSIGGKQSLWKINYSKNANMDLKIEIIEDHPNSIIVWQSLPETIFENAGSARFELAPGEQGTDLHVKFAYRFSPRGLQKFARPISTAAITAQVERCLNTLRQRLEGGESATS